MCKDFAEIDLGRSSIAIANRRNGWRDIPYKHSADVCGDQIRTSSSQEGVVHY
jgi:hypothetical protein